MRAKVFSTRQAQRRPPTWPLMATLIIMRLINYLYILSPARNTQSDSSVGEEIGDTTPKFPLVQEALRNALGGAQGSRSGPSRREGRQAARFECIESPENLGKAIKRKSDSGQAGQPLLVVDPAIPIKVEMTVEELNRIIHDRIVKAEKKKQGIVLLNKDDKSSMSRKILDITIPQRFLFPHMTPYDNKMDPSDHIRRHVSSLLGRTSDERVKILLSQEL
ncbi:hypothetical protein CRG98_037445 [Punica granatum]|uniref:Uncharacterized protein n=1 Tax=Punica granatum TaxID=22663 RepID=A0A2I0IDT1_PUNGR|nr:hypothetical protein CRG98_037445 [Punica granatum]